MAKKLKSIDELPTEQLRLIQHQILTQFTMPALSKSRINRMGSDAIDYLYDSADLMDEPQRTAAKSLFEDYSLKDLCRVAQAEVSYLNHYVKVWRKL